MKESRNEPELRDRVRAGYGKGESILHGRAGTLSCGGSFQPNFRDDPHGWRGHDRFAGQNRLAFAATRGRAGRQRRTELCRRGR